MDADLLRIKDLTISSGNRILVNRLNLNIKSGKVVGLVGESGSGKTLTALSILKLLPPGIGITSGTIIFNSGKRETDITQLSGSGLHVLRGNRISMIFQEPMTSLNPTIRCGSQAREPLMIHSKLSRQEARERVLELFREVKLPDPERVYNAWPHELSGGQRQRVMIAQALTTSPQLLIADEPTTALDVTVQKSILDLLRSLQDKYLLSILFISHDLSVIGRIADSVAVMRHGKIVEQGSKEELLDRPQSPYTKGLLACKPRLDKRPYSLATVEDYMEGRDPLNRKQPELRSRVPEREPLITIRDLSVTYHSGRKEPIRAVQEVTFDIFKGETLGLVGESGCGKTSIGRTLLGLAASASGSISYKNRKLNELSERQFRQFRQKLQIVFQDPYSSLNPRQTAGSIIAEPLKVHKIVKGRAATREECIRLLQQVGLEDDAMQKYPHEFSGGQRQRIGIARALACRPDFIILDESVSALDVSIQAQILNLLNDLKAMYNLTYLFISHDLTVVKYMSDRILVMRQGEIVESGDAEDIYAHPDNPYTRELLSAIPS